ncbi:MAG: aminotransferase class I/II-fold pyridoxal phosphate-dependent enzyme, partial [Bacteroidales bacterium]|nr:aminotransferase class I/II-fold pyridoxal phosphate-dependent enzyme [Bacteroidales bacterium]
MGTKHSVGIEPETLKILEAALNRLSSGFQELDRFTPEPVDVQKLESVLLEVADRMKDNFPYFHPQYAGQMMKPPHPAARLAYMLSLYINPNNHALDGGRASSRMEKEAVALIAGMFGWEKFIGHLTSGGTMANLEGLWVSGLLNPGRLVVASSQSHYTHERMSKLLGLPFRKVAVDHSAKMSIPDLQKMLDTEDVGTVVATVGTTAAGMVDPIPQILKLQEKYHFRIHVDAAYGGYFALARNLAPATQEIFDHLTEVDSLVVDPHKHGMQPFGCGCVLFKDPTVGRFYKHDSPYTYFTSDELHLGEISLECSHSGAAAVALWATQKMMPPVRGGEFSDSLEKGRRAALAFHEKLKSD